MSKNVFLENKINNLFTVINDERNVYVFCSILKDESLKLCCSNGESLYVREIDEQSLESLTEDVCCPSKEEFMRILRLASTNGEVNVTQVSDLCTLRFSALQTSFSLVFYPTTSSAQKYLSKRVFVDMATHITIQNAKIKELTEPSTNNQLVEDIKPFVASSVKHSKRAVPVKHPGTSLLKPGTKRRKAATGVVFEDD